MKPPIHTENKYVTTLLFLLALVLSVLILLFRNPQALFNPQFFAEDGVVFFQENFNYGFRSIFISYGGYMVTAQRVSTLLVFRLFPFEYMPAAYNFASLLWFLGVAAFIWYRTPFNAYIRFFIIITMSLAPIGNEPVLNITNVQWYLAFFIPLLFLTGYNKKYVVIDGIVLFLVALTGPYSVVLLPMVVATLWFRSRNSDNWVWNNERWLFGVYLLATLMQVWVLAVDSHGYGRSSELSEKIAHSPELLYMHVTSPIGLRRLYGEEMNIAIFLVLLAVLAGWLFFCWQKLIKGKNPFPFFFMMAALLLAAATVYGIPADAVNYLNPVNAGSRYFYCPCVLLLWSVLAYSYKPGMAGASTENASRLRGRNLGFLSLFIYYAFILVWKIPPSEFMDKQWSQEAKKIRQLKKGHLDVPTNPDGWKISLDK